MNRVRTLLTASLLALGASCAQGQGVATSVGYPQVQQVQPGQKTIDIVTTTRHPAYLEPQALRTPEGVRIAASAGLPDNARTCPRGAPTGTECRQVFRVTLDTLPRCHAGGNYQALFQINCWPGTPPSLCKPGIHPYDFKLEPLNSCQR